MLIIVLPNLKKQVEKDVRCCCCSTKDPLNQRSVRYGPGYSHVLNSLRESEPEEFDALFPKPTLGTQSRSGKKNARIFTSTKIHIGETSRSIKGKLAPLVVGDSGTQ